MEEKKQEDASDTGVARAQQSAKALKLILVSSVVLWSSLGTGVAAVFATVALPSYQDLQEPILTSGPLTDEQGSWFVSSTSFCSMCGMLLGGNICEQVGRKPPLLAGNALMFTGWAVVYMAQDFSFLMLGRVLKGLGCGVSLSVTYLILSELALVRLRGTFGTLIPLMINMGYLLGLVLGAFLDVQTLVSVSGVIPLLFLCLSFFVPESPLWLVRQGRHERAERVLRRLRGAHYPVMLEIKEMMQSLSQADQRHMRGAGGGLTARVKFFTSKQVIKPCALVWTLFMCLSSSGSETTCFYSLYIFQHAQFEINEYLLSILLQLGFTVGYIVSTPFMSRVGRRQQLITSAALMATSLIILGISMGIQDHFSGNMLSFLRVLQPICVVSTALCYGTGFGPVMYTLVGELFPPAVKGFCSSASLAVKDFSSFINLKIFPSLAHYFGLPLVFCGNGSVCFLVCLIVFLWLPETKGLTITQLTKLNREDKPDRMDSFSGDDDDEATESSAVLEQSEGEEQQKAKKQEEAILV